MTTEEKVSERTAIMVSIQLHERLNTIKNQLRKIIRTKSISLENVIEILLLARPLDIMLSELILEYHPTAIPEQKENTFKLEMLARLEHEQWVEWNKAMPKEFQKRQLWRAYEELTDEEKEKDRAYARKVLKLLKNL